MRFRRYSIVETMVYLNKLSLFSTARRLVTRSILYSVAHPLERGSNNYYSIIQGGITMDKPQWGNPDNFSMVFRCMKQKDARPFFEKGRIKFGTPRSWVEWEKEHGNGRGDQFEGTLATFNIFDVEHRLYL